MPEISRQQKQYLAQQKKEKHIKKMSETDKKQNHIKINKNL